MLQFTRLILICVLSRAMSISRMLEAVPAPERWPGPEDGPHTERWPESTVEVPWWSDGGRGVTIPVVPSAAPTYGPWGTWGRCSKSCGGGTQGRTRKYCISRSGCSDNLTSRKCNSHACPVCQGEWTVWFDRDNPSGNGDYETLPELRKERKLEVCVSPSAIDGRVVKLHTNWYQSGDVVTASTTRGLSCINKNQKHKRLCKDYEVRFCCPRIQNRKDVEFVATTFLKTIHSVTRGGSKPSGPVGRKPAPPPPRCTDHECVREDFFDSNQMLRMVSRRVIRRQKRETISEVLMRKKRQAETGPVKTKRDVLFLIDESGSVDSDNFEKFKRLTQAIIKTFCGKIDVGETKTRVAVHSFDAKQHHHIEFKDYFSKQQVLSGIDSVAYDHSTDHSTCLIESLQYSRESLFTPSRGARMQQPDTEQLLVLLSDGCANCKPQSQRAKLLKEVAEKLSQQGIAILTVFVAPQSSSSTSCVDKMVPLIDGSHCYQTFRAYSWDEVDVFADTIEAAGCSDEWTLTAACPPSPAKGSSSTERSTNEAKRVSSSPSRRLAAPPQRAHPRQQAMPSAHQSRVMQ